MTAKTSEFLHFLVNYFVFLGFHFQNQFKSNFVSAATNIANDTAHWTASSTMDVIPNVNPEGEALKSPPFAPAAASSQPPPPSSSYGNSNQSKRRKRSRWDD